MKKFLILTVCVATMLLTLTACGEKVECEFCGEEKRCKTTTVLGEEINYCADCEDEINEMFEEDFQP